MNSMQFKTQATYNAAADSFDSPANSYWERYGTRTVARLGLAPGDHVLDVACGTGASALPAAVLVGPSGRVVGVDLAEKQLVRARDKALQRGLHNLEFRLMDMTQLDYAAHSFDAVVCVFGIFFVPDMEAQVARLWRLVSPGGTLALTTWGPNLFEPMNSHFKAAIGQLRSDMVPTQRPWQRLTTPAALEALLHAGGAQNISTTIEEGEQPLHDPAAWWQIVLGSGLRAAVEAVGEEMATAVRHQNAAVIQREGIDTITTNVIYGVARKPATAWLHRNPF